MSTEPLRPLTREQLDANFKAALTDTTLQWHNALDFTIEGRGWRETALLSPYHRFPARAEAVVRREVWELSKQSSGIFICFSTDASEISAQWTVTNHDLAMEHMPATGVSGLDLYVKYKEAWKWIGVGRPVKSPTNKVLLASGIPNAERILREFRLYLPLYNGVIDLRIGVPKTAVIKKTLPQTGKTVVFYGTSITQGGCTSRPGMSYPSILGRTLDISSINLGFSGNGQAEAEVAGLIAELDPAVFVLDPLPNLKPHQVEERIPPFVRIIRERHPNTPIILVENITPSYDYLQDGTRSNHKLRNESLKIVAQKLMENDKNIYCINGESLFGDDSDGTVDGIHPTTLGFYRMAEVIRPELKKVLATTS